VSPDLGGLSRESDTLSPRREDTVRGDCSSETLTLISILSLIGRGSRLRMTVRIKSLTWGRLCDILASDDTHDLWRRQTEVAMKKVWKKPQLVVLMRSRPEEIILQICKVDWPATGLGAQNDFNICASVGTSCTVLCSGASSS
jgi:hypothetical protein